MKQEEWRTRRRFDLVSNHAPNESDMTDFRVERMIH
jgi:hypothetical protein